VITWATMGNRWVLLALFAAGVVMWLARHGAQAQQDVGPRWDTPTILIRAGVTDNAPKMWKGLIEPASAGARVLAVSGYRFQSGDVILADSNRWELATRPWVGLTQVDLSPARPGLRPILPNGVYATVQGDASARFRMAMDSVQHTFALGELAAGKMISLAGGNVEIELAPTPALLSEPGNVDADFPALATGADGRLALAWQEFTGERDRVHVREFDGKSWLAAERFETPETRDVYRTAAVFDGQGALHVVWSAQVDGNWDLYSRRRTREGWQAVERLTTAPGTDFHHRLTADARGDLWLAWQAFRDTQSDIYLRRMRQGNWGGEVKVSESRANDWEPALAVTPQGTVWVGWDSYDRGNYDIFVRSYGGGSPGPVRAVTSSPRFEAHAGLAADPQGRLWIGFDQAETNWGKDYGYLFKDRGNPLYQTRRLGLVRLSGDRIEEPRMPLSEAFPLGVPDFLHYSQLHVATDGAVTILAQQLTHADRVLEVWGARGVWENVVITLDGSGWKRHRVLPDSRGAHDIRAALAADASGNLYAAWAGDLRNFGAGGPQRQRVYAARIERPTPGGEIALRAFQERPELAFSTHPTEAAEIGAVRGYRVASGGKRYRIFRGDLHRHTALSGDGVGDGSLWDFYRYMLDASDMDIASVTDHQGGATPYNWWKTQKSVDLFLVPGRLTTLYAYERSIRYPNGHRNIVLPRRGVPILPASPEEQQGRKRSAEEVIPYLRKHNAIAFRHTIATDQGTDWKDHDNELEPLVEIYQGHRVVYEHEGGPKGATAEKPYLHRSGYQPAGFFWNALARGHRMGIQASSDHCSTHISYSCILAENGTREALIDAMRRRRTYGATDNIVLDVRVKAGDREYLQD